MGMQGQGHGLTVTVLGVGIIVAVRAGSNDRRRSSVFLHLSYVVRLKDVSWVTTQLVFFSGIGLCVCVCLLNVCVCEGIGFTCTWRDTEEGNTKYENKRGKKKRKTRAREESTPPLPPAQQNAWKGNN